eukprot:jgi/Astpho2/3385/Aster-x0158
MDRPYEEQPAAKRQRQEAGAVEPDGAHAAGALLEVVPPEHQDDVPTPDADAQAMEAAMKEQKEVEKFNQELNAEVLQLEQRYNRLKQPVYLRRNLELRKIQDFWMQVLLRHHALMDQITTSDVDILSFLEEIVVEENDDVKTGFKITMQFRNNPYFTNTQLVKQLHYSEDGVSSAEATPPEWTEEGELHQKKASDYHQSHGGHSLFSWFWDTVYLNAVDVVSQVIRDSIWPDCISIYNGSMDAYDGSLSDDEGEVSEGEVAEGESRDIIGEDAIVLDGSEGDDLQQTADPLEGLYTGSYQELIMDNEDSGEEEGAPDEDDEGEAD